MDWDCSLGFVARLGIGPTAATSAFLSCRDVISEGRFRACETGSLFTKLWFVEYEEGE